MKTETPFQKAFSTYMANRYYVPQLMALAILGGVIYYADELEGLFDIILILIPICGALFVPFVFLIIWTVRNRKESND